MTSRNSTTRGWVAFLGVVLIFFFYFGFISNTRQLLVAPMSEDLGLDPTFLTATIGFGGYVNIVVSFFFAKVMNVIGLRKTIGIGVFAGVAWAVCMVLSGFTSGTASAVIIVIGQLLTGVLFSWAGVMAIAIVINNWFAYRRNLMTNIAIAAGGLGGVIGSPVVAAWIDAMGWRNESLLMTVVAVVSAVLIIVCIKVKPEPGQPMIWEHDEKAAAGDKKLEEKGAKVSSDGGLTLKEAMKTRQFWFAIIFFLLLGYSVYPLFIVLPVHASAIGLGAETSAGMSIMYAANIVAPLVFGWMLDRLGNRISITLGLVIAVVTLATLSAGEISAVVFFLCCAGAGVAIVLTQFSVSSVTRAVFGYKEFEKIQGFIYPFNMIGIATSLSVMSIVAGFAGGSYVPVFQISIALCFLTIVFLFLCTAKITQR